MTKEKKLMLAEAAAKIRLLSAEAVYHASSGHPGGSLSIAEIIAYLYFDKLRIDPADPRNPDRDRFVLSKGHTCPALYAALAMRGFFDESALNTLRKKDSFLQGHPDMNSVPGVDMSTGSLGQGISAANGMALAGKRRGASYRVYSVLGDGELQEGQVWEAAMFAAHYSLGNHTAFVDFNGLQIDGDVRKVMNPLPIDEKFAAFGWHVQCIDGHDLEQIEQAVLNAESDGRPSVIICSTVKGKGISFMENVADWHGKAPDEKQFAVAREELYAAYVKAKEARENG